MIIAGQNLKPDGMPVNHVSPAGLAHPSVQRALGQLGIPLELRTAEMEAVVVPAAMWREIARQLTAQNTPGDSVTGCCGHPGCEIPVPALPGNAGEIHETLNPRPDLHRNIGGH